MVLYIIYNIYKTTILIYSTGITGILILRYFSFLECGWSLLLSYNYINTVREKGDSGPEYIPRYTRVYQYLYIINIVLYSILINICSVVVR